MESMSSFNRINHSLCVVLSREDFSYVRNIQMRTLWTMTQICVNHTIIQTVEHLVSSMNCLAVKRFILEKLYVLPQINVCGFLQFSTHIVSIWVVRHTLARLAFKSYFCKVEIPHQSPYPSALIA